MSTRKLSNIPLQDFRKFLKSQGLKVIKDSQGRGGHEKWSKSNSLAFFALSYYLNLHIQQCPERAKCK